MWRRRPRSSREQIDILVDLNGYFGSERTGVFACKPAPVQVNYLGFPGTMGADYMDYILADATVIPPDQRGFYTEKVVYLPDFYQANDTKRRIAERAPSRQEYGLPDRAFVFCCFNNSYKITPEVFDVWMRLLGEVEGSVLWLLQHNEVTPRNLRREAATAGHRAGATRVRPRHSSGRTPRTPSAWRISFSIPCLTTRTPPRTTRCGRGFPS